jgi:hypothetical protein
MPSRTRSLMREIKKHMSKSTTGSTGSAGFPRANGFNGCFELSLVIGLSCHHRRAMHSHRRDLTPASRRQDHTTSPSASMRVVFRAPPRPSQPAPNVRDDREAPLLEERGPARLVEVICPTAQAKIRGAAIFHPRSRRSFHIMGLMASSRVSAFKAQNKSCQSIEKRMFPSFLAAAKDPFRTLF